MCVTAGPARLSNTILYAAEVGRVHVLGYQNMVQNESPGPNAMILPFPAVPGTMTRDNVVSTEGCPNILKDMAEAIRPIARGGLVSKSIGRSRVEVFESGIYTVVLADDASLIPKALQHSVSPDKRPIIGKELFEAYSEWYPEWPIAVCCFNNRDAKVATPMLWWYEPTSCDSLFAPALDCHTGGVPDLSADVDVDHTVIVGSNLMRHGLGTPVHFSDLLPALVQPWIVTSVMGRQMKAKLPNGDFMFKLQDVRDGLYDPDRIRPDTAR